VSLRGRIERWLNGIWYHGAPVPGALGALETVYRKFAGPMVRPGGRPPRPVIVVGNLVAGGSGKTPVVIALVHALAVQGYSVSVISRGYGGSGSRQPRRVGIDDRAAEVGDEALEIARATGRPVWIARRRAEALQAAVEDGAEVIIADDGLQHAALPRSLEICLVDARRGFGNGRLLPAGPLRQPVSRLETIDLVLLRTVDDAPGDAARRLPGAIPFSIRTFKPKPADTTVPELPPPPLELDAVAGIADPEPFFGALERLGYGIRRHRLADHQPISRRWLQGLAGPVVTTAKDHARMGQIERSDLYVLPVQAILPAAAVDLVLAHVREFAA
jgi:tetraacyldisaccharide 4'-kinase